MSGYNLFEFADHISQSELAADERLKTLVVTLNAFGDTGHTQRLLNNHILNSLPNHEVGKFDFDQLHDYTDNRPGIVFEFDHFTDYQTPQIVLHEVTDDQGVPFLLLTGPEPSLRWERMASSIEALNEQLGIEQTIFLQAIPAPTPHTRPVFINAYASRPGLISDWDKLPATIQLQSSFTAMLAVRLGEASQDVLGLVAHIPHYLADLEFVDGPLALIKTLRKMEELDLPEGELHKISETTHAAIDSQVESSEDLREVIEQLERRYDEFVARRTLTESGDEIPTADQIGAEVEEFLRQITEDESSLNDADSEDFEGKSDSDTG